MTAPISPGSSGGPVLNSKGEVIGVSFMILEGAEPKFCHSVKLSQGTASTVKPVKPLTRRNQSISAETYFSRGNVNRALGNYSEAIASYTEASNNRGLLCR